MLKQSSLLCCVLMVISAPQLSAQAASPPQDRDAAPLYIGAGALSGAVLFALILSDQRGSSHSVFMKTQNPNSPAGNVTPPGNTTTNSENGTGNEDVPLTTPEPGTAALLTAGFVGLAGVLRRRAIALG